MRILGPRLSYVGLATSLFLLALITSCGIKAPPVPPGKPTLPAVRDLKVTLGSDLTARLQWHTPQDADHVAGYKIYRAVSDPLDPPCPGCPVMFETIGRVDRIASETTYSFADPVAAGLIYQYKVIVVFASGAAGPDSNIFRVQAPGDKSTE